MQYRFGKFSLKLEEQALYCKGKLINQDARLLDVLQRLCEAHPKSVSKDSLIQYYWPNRPVQDTAVSRLIADLRILLGDNGKEQNYIKTEWNRGYKISCPVSVHNTPKPKPLKHLATFFKARAKHLSIALGGIFLLAGTLALLLLGPARTTGNTDINKEITLAIIPVNVKSDIPNDAWIGLGIPSVILNQFKDYPKVRTIPLRATLERLENLGLEGELKPDQLLYKSICQVLECDHLIYLEYHSDEVGKHLSYNLLSDDYVSSTTTYSYKDTIYSAERVVDHLADQILPARSFQRKQNKALSSDPIANRSYAIGINDSFRGNLREAEVNLKLAIERDRRFFWAKLELTSVYWRQTRIEEFSSLLEELQGETHGELDKQTAVLAMQSALACNRGEIRKSIALGKKVLAVREASGDIYAILHARGAIAFYNMLLGDIENALILMKKNLKQYEKLDSSSGIAMSNYTIGTAYMFRGEYEKARKHHQLGKLKAIESKKYLLANFARRRMADIELETGKSGSELSAKYDEIISEFNKLGSNRGVLFTTTSLIRLKLAQGYPQEAWEDVLKHLEVLTKERYPRDRNIVLALAANISLVKKDYATARHYLKQRFGEWGFVNTADALLEARINYAEGNHSLAIKMAESLKRDFGINWSEGHQKILDSFHKRSPQKSEQRFATLDDNVLDDSVKEQR